MSTAARRVADYHIEEALDAVANDLDARMLAAKEDAILHLEWLKNELRQLAKRLSARASSVEAAREALTLTGRLLLIAGISSIVGASDGPDCGSPIDTARSAMATMDRDLIDAVMVAAQRQPEANLHAVRLQLQSLCDALNSPGTTRGRLLGVGEALVVVAAACLVAAEREVASQES